MSIQAVAWVLDHSDTQKTERCVLIAAANHTDYLGLFYAGAELLAHEARCSERHAVRLRQALADPDRPGGPAIRQLTESEIEALPDEHPYRRIRPDRRPPIFEMVGFPRPDRTSPRGQRGDTHVSPRDLTGRHPVATNGVTKPADGVTKPAPRGDTAMSPEPKGTKKNPSRAHARERAAAELSELIDDPLIDWNDDPLNGSGTAAPDRTRRVDPLESIRAVRDAHRQDLEDGS